MRRVAFVAISFWMISCTGEQVNDSTTPLDFSGTHSDAVPAGSLGQLATARIYFGHQSVGRNIVDGLRDLNAAGSGDLRIVSSRELSSGAPALLEFPIGENGRPESKMKDFAAALQKIDDKAPAIAMFKYCYLDFSSETDVELLFASHRKALQEMRAGHPNLVFVHVTVPLTRLESGPRFLAKRLLGKPTTREANEKRNRFNAMLRQEYAGEPMFDLAKVESTSPNGSRSFFNDGGEIVYTLAPELTDDGGHLNAAGRRAAAWEFASTIGVVAARQTVTERPIP